jgi:outer membrane protein assembly factor BamB
LFAWNSATGTDKWQAWSLEDPVTDEAGNIIAYSHYGQYISNTFYGETVSLTPNGVPRWTNLVGNYKPAVDFVDSAKRVFVHADRTLFALSTETGEVLWSFTADAKIVTPATLASGGNIYFVDQLNNAYLLEANLDYARSTWPIAIYGNRRHTGKSAVFLVQPPRR